MQKAAAVNSPYIVKIIEFSETEIIMEYIDGQPLSEAKLPHDLTELFRELCEGVSALHSVGVIHRDIKPSNIMLCGGHIKIIDFDAARIKKPEAEKDTSFIGTDGFAPPEQYGFQQTDERSDIYSIGVTMKLLLRENYQNSPLRCVAEKCMRFDPNKRYASAKAVSRAVLFCKFRPAVIAAICIVLCICVVLLITSRRDITVSEPETSESSAITYYKVIEEELTEQEESIDELYFLPSGFPELPGNISFIADDSYIHSIYWYEMTLEETKEFANRINDWIKDIGELVSSESFDDIFGSDWVYPEGKISLLHNEAGCELTFSK